MSFGIGVGILLYACGASSLRHDEATAFLEKYAHSGGVFRLARLAIMGY